MNATTILKALLEKTPDPMNVAGAASSYLIPEIVDGAIRDYTQKEPVIYNAVTRVPWATNTYFIRKRTANPTATWGTDGANLPDATRTQHTKVSMPVAYLYTRGEVTGPAARAAGSFVNALAMEIEAHSRALVSKLATDIISATGSGDSLQGILHQIETNDVLNAADQSAGGGVVTKSGALTLAMIDEAIDTARGDVDMIVASRAVRRKINSLLQAQQQFVDRVEIQAGFRVLAYDGLPIVTDLHWESGTKIAFIRRADAKLLVHQDFTYEPLAKTKDSEDFYIKWYGGFALEGRPVELTGFDSIS